MLSCLRDWTKKSEDSKRKQREVWEEHEEPSVCQEDWLDKGCWKDKEGFDKSIR